MVLAALLLLLVCVPGRAAADDRPSRPLGKLPRPLALGSSQLSLPAEDPKAFAASLAAGTWLAVGAEDIPLRQASSSPGAVVLELLWPTGSAHYQGTPLALLLSRAGCEDEPPSTMVLSQLPPAGSAWPRWLGALDLSAPSFSHPLLLVYQPRSGAFGVSALPADASRCNGPSAPLASGRLAPFRRHVALPGGQLLSFSPRDGSFEAFQCDWQQLLPPALQRAGQVDALSFNRSRAVDSLPCVRQTHGSWPALRGFELSVVGGHKGAGARLLAFDEATARFSLWEYDADVTGHADPIRFSEGAVASGSWQRTLGEAPQQLSLLQPMGDASFHPTGQETRALPPPTLLLRDASSASYSLWAAEWLPSPAAGAHVMDGGDAGCALGVCSPQPTMENALQPQAMEMLRSLGALPPQAEVKAEVKAEKLPGESSSRPRLTPELLRDDDGAIYTLRHKPELLRPVAAAARWSSAPSHRLEPLPAAAHRELAALWVEAGETAGEELPAARSGSGTKGGGKRGAEDVKGEETGEVSGEVTLVEWDAAGSALFRLLSCRYSARGMHCDTLHGGHALRPSWPCDARTSAAGCAQEKDFCLWCNATHRCVPAAIGAGGRSSCLDGYIEGIC